MLRYTSLPLEWFHRVGRMQADQLADGQSADHAGSYAGTRDPQYVPSEMELVAAAIRRDCNPLAKGDRLERERHRRWIHHWGIFRAINPRLIRGMLSCIRWIVSLHVVWHISHRHLRV